MGEFEWLIKLLPEGASVTAVISVVVLFLRFFRELNADHKAAIEKLTTTFTDSQREERKTFADELKEARNSFSTQLTGVTTVFSERHEAMQEKMVALTDSHLKFSYENISALNGLKDAVRELQNKATK